MDPLSHALIGGLAAKTVGASKRRFWIMCLLGMAPDLDVLAGLFGGWAFIFQHRGISHSFIGVVFQSVFWAWLLVKFDGGSFKERAFHYSIPLGAHIFCDYLTCFGVPLFSPFSIKEYSLDLMSSVNVVPLLLTLFGIIWLHKKNHEGWQQTRLLWGMWVGYLLLSMTGKVYAGRILGDSKAVAMPMTVGSFKWRAVQSDSDRQYYRTQMVDLIKGASQEQIPVAMPDKSFPVQSSLASIKVRQFLVDNRWPVVQTMKRGDSWIVDWGTLLFSTKGLVRGKVRVEVSSQGEILSENKIFTFWNPGPVS